VRISVARTSVSDKGLAYTAGRGFYDFVGGYYKGGWFVT